MLLCILVYFLSVCAFGTTSTLMEKEVEYLLPQNVKPIRYNLTMIPNFETDTFSGSVSIEIKVLKSSNFITLHVYKLEMPSKEDITVEEIHTGRTLAVQSAEISNSKYEYYTFTFFENLREDTVYVLSIPKFGASFAEGASGFSSGSFKDSDGSIKKYAYTHFQPCDARKAFPCFDEPGIRAKFNIRLVRPNAQFISASNMPLVSQSTSAPFEDVFEESVEMPTYLVTFTVSEMKFSETLDRFRIIARPDAINKGQHKYALNLTVDVFNFMETYTGVPFVLPKEDQLAVPAYGGGMENWGLILYGDYYLLLTEGSDKHSMTVMIAHEIAHQWFGNLVCLTWWEYLWLNEGFATYFQYLIPPQVEPSIDGRGLFLSNHHSSFITDKSSSRPLNYNIDSPDYMLYLFDNIAYSKGGAVVHMLETSLTTPVFQKGIRYYIENMKFDQATPSILYQNLQKAVDEVNSLPESLTVSQFMSSWDSVSSFPVVEVHRNYDDSVSTITLAQKVYYGGGVGQWIIPINFATSSNPSFDNTNPDHWITESEETVTLSYLSSTDWLIANKQETGYYRVNYDNNNWKRIAQALKANHLDIHVLNRAQIIDDSLNLGETGYLDYELALEVVSYIENEEDPIPWKAYNRNIRKLATFFYYSPNYIIFKEYNFNILKTVYGHVGHTEGINETTLKKDLRKIVLDLLCKLDHPDCLRESLKRYKHSQSTKQSITKLDTNTLCGAIRAGNTEDFNYLFNSLEDVDVSPSHIIAGLSCSKSVDNLARLFNLHDKLPLNKIIELVMDGGPEGLQSVVTFLSKNFKAVEEKLEHEANFLFRKVAVAVTTDFQLHDLKKAVSQSKNVDFLKKWLTEAEENIIWRRNHLEFLSEILKQRF